MSLPQDSPARMPPLAAGKLLFKRYRYERELGRGGMGLVILARDEVLGTQVALKLVPEEVVLDGDGLRELKREVLRGMALSHPNIVRVHSFEQEGAEGAIVMEFVDGETLAEAKTRQAQGCFEHETVRPWLEQLCGVLDHAHQEVRIAHRDLKPRNILLNREHRIKVADFGISCSLNETLHRLTSHRDASGTPPYMSPQQAMGEPPSHLDDFYSLGATLYDLLTGKPPFYRGNVVLQVLEAIPPPMSERRAELGKQLAPIPGAWEALVAACLAKNPSRRPASGGDVLALLGGDTLPTRADTPRAPVRIAPSPMESSAPAPEPSAAPLRLPRITPAAPSPTAARVSHAAPEVRRKDGGSGLAAEMRSAGSALLAGAAMAGMIHLFTVVPPAATPAPAPPSKPPMGQNERLNPSKIEPSGGLDAPATELRHGPPPSGKRR